MYIFKIFMLRIANSLIYGVWYWLAFLIISVILFFGLFSKSILQSIVMSLFLLFIFFLGVLAGGGDLPKSKKKINE